MNWLAIGVGKLHQVRTILRLAKLFAQTIELVYIYPPLTPCYFFNATDPETLPVLYGSHKVACFQQTVAITRIEPCKTTAKDFNL